ncbi:MAG TPA: hypothetical protein VID48_01605 [Solirubrobacteraceae bacterium]|jgi:hypothetical protein
MTSGHDTPTKARWPALAQRLGPLPAERRGRGELRLIETTVLVLVGILLAIATVNDLTRQVHINHRLQADLHTWRHYTGHDYRNLSLEQDVKTYSSRDVVCGNTSPGAPGTHNQVCLVMSGPLRAGARAVHGGYYLPAYQLDIKANRYGCFGTAASARLCGLGSPPSGGG